MFLLFARGLAGCHVAEADHLKPAFLMMSSKEAGGGCGGGGGGGCGSVLLYLPDSRWRWIGESYARHVLFALPVTFQMSPGKTASIPARLFPSDFSNGVGNSRAGVGEQLQGATGREGERERWWWRWGGGERQCSSTAFMINSICIFIDKCYSTGNSAPVISHRGCSSKQDLMIYPGAG